MSATGPVLIFEASLYAVRYEWCILVEGRYLVLRKPPLGLPFRPAVRWHLDSSHSASHRRRRRLTLARVRHAVH